MHTCICLYREVCLSSRGFCLESFGRGGFCPSPLLSEYIRNNRKLNITFNFRFRMYEEKFKKCDVTCSWILPFLKLSQLLGPPPPSVAETWRRDFWMRFFWKKFPFSRPKFLMTFLVIDQVFPIFPFFCRIWPFPHKNNNHCFRKEFLYDTFLLCSYFRARPTTLLLKILGGRMHGPSPTSNFVGDRPLGLRPCPPLELNILYGRPLTAVASAGN